MRICRSRSLICASCSKEAVRSPTVLSLVSSATRTIWSRSASLVPISCSRRALATCTALSRSAAATPIEPFFTCSATSMVACWIASEAALRPIASM